MWPTAEEADRRLMFFGAKKRLNHNNFSPLFRIARFFTFQSIIAGDYILAMASGMLARLQNEQVIMLLSQV